MSNRRLLILSAFIALVVVSCKKDGIVSKTETEPILKISNNAGNNRINLTNNNLVVGFSSVQNLDNSIKSIQATEEVYPYELAFDGKIESLKDNNGTPLNAIDVTSYSNGLYGVSYMTIGEKYYGGVDLFTILPSNAPALVSTVVAENADINRIKIGGNKVFLGIDLETHDNYNLETPAVVGVIDINSNTLQNPQYVSLNGYSVKDIHYAESNQKLYAASATHGGVSVISFSGENASKTAYQPYGGARSLVVSNGQLIATNGYSYAGFNLNTAAQSAYKWWPIPSDGVGLGALTTLSNGNFLFGNNFALIYVDAATGSLLDQVDVGGWIYSISVVNDKIYVAAGNNILVATINGGKINVLAQTHFESTFGPGNFVINNVHVANDKVLVTCGPKGTYVFTLQDKL